MKRELPKRLTISFPIWGLYSTTNGYYSDTDKMMKEHVERGFNCMRLDDGAGLIHDLEGKKRGAVELCHAFGKYTAISRQIDGFGVPGKCDLHERLIRLFASAKNTGCILFYHLGIFYILFGW